MMGSYLLLLLVSLWTSVTAWLASSTTRRIPQTLVAATLDLTGDGGVLLVDHNDDCQVEEPTVNPPEPGTELTFSYKGTIVESHWTPQEVVTCWLSSQQGLESLPFSEHSIDEAKLLTLTEDYVTATFPDLTTIQAKKLVMAAKRLATSRSSTGTVFDQRDSYTITWGKTKLIPGMLRALEYGWQQSSWTVVCRSDYAYGAEGYRKPTGEVVVPPFATLQFEISLLSS